MLSTVDNFSSIEYEMPLIPGYLTGTPGSHTNVTTSGTLGAHSSYVLGGPSLLARQTFTLWQGIRSRKLPISSPDEFVQISNSLASLLAAKREQKGRLHDQLEAAKSEALEENLPPLTPRAKQRCLEVGFEVINQYFWMNRLKVVASAKLNGGATLVAIDRKEARRIDFEFPPDGSNPELFASEKDGKITRSVLDSNHKTLDSWLRWLLH